MWEDLCRLSANMTPLYIFELEHSKILESVGGPGTSPLTGIPRDDCTLAL